MADDWFYAQGSEQRGPLTWEALQALARSAQLNAQTLVWKAGMEQWQPAGSVPGLLVIAPPAYSAPVFSPAQANIGLNYAGPASGQMEYAGFWLRFCAYMIDTLIIVIVIMIVVVALRAAAGNMVPAPVFAPGRPAQIPPLFVLSACGLPIGEMVALWLYFAMMESSAWQATVGKMALGIRVTDMHGQRISFGRASGRFFGKLLSGIIFNIGYIMAGFTQRKQALHDMLADTLVIRR